MKIKLIEVRGGADKKPPALGMRRRAGRHQRQNLGGRPPGGPKGRRLPSLPLLRCLEKSAKP
jgi:hypothetical protein